MPNDLNALIAHDKIIRWQTDVIRAMEFLVHALRDGPVQEHTIRSTAGWQRISDRALAEASRRFAVQSYVVDGTSWWQLKSDA